MIRRFNRFELKYLVTADQRDALIEDLLPHMAPDPEGSKEGIYKIRSLYFDTHDLAFYRSKIDGNRYRRKVRIRVYGNGDNSPEQPAMVEIKQRISRTTQKRRVKLTLGEAFELCAGRLETPPKDPRDLEVAQEIGYLVGSLHLQPTCLISYVRQAFMGGIYEPGLRVTFDTALWCADPSRGFAEPHAPKRFLDPRYLVLEVKANDAVPLWVARALARHGCELDRFSKYCAGVSYLRATHQGAVNE